ncbi:TPA: hypothetical protein DCZ46_03850 [Candidatus Campbellbacteria bacterium]|nr:MAG: Transposase [Candidatus Campbellbacteria bacterium GW2011_GWD2_35_24]KKP76553.1 MAG: Transposase [Candidatus Campbellbacteria bacterium GW2011_GWC1_35_31]KKP78592.1 MAG: Transposase [Candidatus Campbellbacteria bacterium GW2011_GWD1_35_49]HAP74024.1 hypothetical protein [Candidatus Campbellbacteria bacterium]HAQ01863.1 hypothetical protein [Candidatus Campbellbacteria bacterium]
MRKVPFKKGEYYHVFNRGVDKRNIFVDKYDAFRFLQSIEIFNSVKSRGDLFHINTNKNRGRRTSSKRENNSEKLVNIVCYCLNPNHYHFILEQLVDGGISEFMKRLGGGYTKYFNERYERSGALFQGKFKSVFIETNEQLLYDSVYVGLNNKVHPKFEKFGKHFLDLIPNRSSWGEYTDKNSKYKICKKDIISEQFKDAENYKKFAESLLKEIRERRYEDQL